jgi:hypothetical protein
MSAAHIDFNKVANRGYMNPTQDSLACETTSMGFKIMVKILRHFLNWLPRVPEVKYHAEDRSISRSRPYRPTLSLLSGDILVECHLC